MLKLYTKPGCYLCDVAKVLLEKAGLRLEEVNIQGDPSLQTRYGHDIPVLVAEDGQVLLKGRFSEAMVASLGARLGVGRT